MKNIDPTKTFSWKYLKKHFQEIKKITINDLFIQDPNRFNNFSINFENKILFDYSKNIINQKTLSYLINLAKETKCFSSIYSMFYGKKINVTEKKSVLHTALRYNHNILFLKNKEIYNMIDNILKKIKNISNDIILGRWKGYTNKKIKNIINIGIGGSQLGPLMVTETLKEYKNKLNLFFLANIDPIQIINLINQINPEESVFIIASKTFNTQETITNALSIKKWFINHINGDLNKNIFSKHFIAVTNNIDAAIDFGINKKNILPLLSEIGGRFSLWSSIGLIISLSIGFNNFEKLLQGASEMDYHFFSTPLDKNIPIIMALISIWYSNFWNTETEAIIPYCDNMRFLPSYLQQLNMESNGKSIDRNGNKILYQTSPIIWGDVGTNGQHSFFQMLHQGTKIIPCDFIAAAIPYNNKYKDHHLKLISNYIAQTKALAFGNIKNIHKNNIYKFCFGNKPSNSIFLKKITPYNLGLLISFYEHKVFVQGIILNIFSFDQWGVELGKKITNFLVEDINSNIQEKINQYDCSSKGIINFYKNFN
ncbi:glucose-6-phosphate isomerase [Enterobacteriaceae endosymbiont of Donacia bicoloricornis]|uniref:glucose-6-phosphate isomerase n=1 Tax=Enterobacteriaceae endosymbiont of Donacia bicoloricornis TaxID=2675772 RepID=UPI0014493271|nr:glucose-6-phosphate isomerase [Enterobacteriaceae endosymbiont of Donacia bicoloricornis]QJC37820.1 glucose-6-phosphate isomerase [Enterobacteriaceae endosymbiont of Donacia bicoloricornis]